MGTYWGREAYLLGKTMLGVKYVFGGEGPDGDDCSGLCQYVYKKNGITIPRTSEEQCKIESVSGAYWNGDLLFFRGATDEQSPGHVGMFAGYGTIGGTQQHTWTGSGQPGPNKRLIILNAPFTGDTGGIRFDYAPGPVLFHTRPGNLRKDPD